MFREVENKKDVESEFKAFSRDRFSEERFSVSRVRRF